MIVDFNIDNYNKNAQEFYNTWIDKKNVIAVYRERRNLDSRREDKIFYWGEMDDVSKKRTIRCATMPRIDAGGRSCFYGDINHFLKVRWADMMRKHMPDTSYNLLEKWAFWFEPRDMRRFRQVMCGMLGVDEKDVA